MRIDRPDAGLEFPVEEAGEVRVDAQIFRDFVEVDAEDPTVELEARPAQVVRNGELVEAAPDSGDGFEREGGHDLDLPAAARGVYSLPLWWRRVISKRAAFSSLDAHELEEAQEGDAQADGDGFPLYLGGTPCVSCACAEALIVFGILLLFPSSPAVREASSLKALNAEAYRTV